MYIYKTTNTINGKFYIGKSQRDIKESEAYFGSGLILQRAIKKHGKEYFIKEIIDTADTMTSLDKKEIFWIKTLKTQDINIGYNIADGGSGGNTGGMSKETKQRKSIVGKDGYTEFQRQGFKAFATRQKDPLKLQESIDKSNNSKQRILENGLTVVQDAARRSQATMQIIKSSGLTGREEAAINISKAWKNKTEEELNEFKEIRSKLATIQMANESQETKNYKKQRLSEVSSDTVSAFHIITQEYKRIPTEAYNNNELWVGLRWKGFYEIIYPDGEIKLLTKLPLIKEYAEEIGVKEDWITRRLNKDKPFKHYRSCHKHLDGVVIIQHSLEEVKNYFKDDQLT